MAITNSKATTTVTNAAAKRQMMRGNSNAANAIGMAGMDGLRNVLRSGSGAGFIKSNSGGKTSLKNSSNSKNGSISTVSHIQHTVSDNNKNKKSLGQNILGAL
jgi:hypothetical protein